MRPARGGFTFIELVIAGTMIAILFVGLSTHLRGGMTVWREATRRIEALEEEQAAFDRLQRDLAQSVAYYTDPTRYGPQGLPPMQWSSDQARWYAVDRDQGVRLVTYRCAAVEDASWWVRTSLTLEAARAPSGGVAAEPAVEPLLPGCKALSLRYGYLPLAEAAEGQINWQAAWPDNPADPPQLPRLIEMRLTLEDGRQTQKVLLIPHGVLDAYNPGAAS